MACLVSRGIHPELKAFKSELKKQGQRLEDMSDKLEYDEVFTDLKHGIADLQSELDDLRSKGGKLKAMENVRRATHAVLNLASTFNELDVDASGTISVAELRRGLHLVGLDSHSEQANAIVERYTHDATIDIKVFTTLVRDIQLLLTFDQDGGGTLDAAELKPALAQLGLKCSDRNIEKIIRAWDADNSGKLDLLEFTDLVRSLRTFMKYDKDGSGDIDVEELRPALRRLGLPADTETANNIIKWYDADESGRIELHEFAVLARDVSVFAIYDRDRTGTLDAAELRSALAKLGLAASEKEVRRILDAWDDNEQGSINLLEFSEIIRDLQVFEMFDVDHSGYISPAELRAALSKLGVHLTHPETAKLMESYDDDQSGTIEFAEFRRLANDLPNLVGRERGSFYSMHGGHRAYVHKEDVNDEAMHVDLDQTFKSKSSKKKDGSKAGGSVLGSAGPMSVLGGVAVAPNPAQESNPFDSRMTAILANAGARPVNLRGHAPPLHQSRKMVRD
jgi:Ca2+-binding EF-hand superfamily protein